MLKADEEKLKGAIILAGGDSKRLGRPKALLDFFGQPLIDLVFKKIAACFSEITVVTDRPDLYDYLPVRLTDDLLKHGPKTPLRGIHAGLCVSDLPHQFVVACDMPLLKLEMIRYMSRFAGSYDAVVPRVNNYYQPLHAFYKRSCTAIIEKQLELGNYKVSDFYNHISIKYIGPDKIRKFDPDQVAFININTREDYENTLAMMERIESGF